MVSLIKTRKLLTNSVDEDAGEDEVEDVEHGPSPESYHVCDIGIRFRAA